MISASKKIILDEELCYASLYKIKIFYCANK